MQCSSSLSMKFPLGLRHLGKLFGGGTSREGLEHAYMFLGKLGQDLPAKRRCAEGREEHGVIEGANEA